MNRFKAIAYINLGIRKKRNSHILKELQKLNVRKNKIHRIEAVYTPLNGHKGCALSHIKALDIAIENNWDNILILEDDCHFLFPKKIVVPYLDHFFHNVKNNWDVFFLGGKIVQTEKTKWPHILRVTKSTVSHSYIVNKHYYKTLKKTYLQAYKSMEDEIFAFQSTNTPIDRAWQKLQKKDRWFVQEIIITSQKNLGTDIEKKASDFKN